MRVKYSDIGHFIVAFTLMLTATCYDLIILVGIPMTVLVFLEAVSILFVLSKISKKMNKSLLLVAAMLVLIAWRNSYQGSYYYIYLIMLYMLLFLLFLASPRHLGYRWFQWYIFLSMIMYAVYAIATYICAASPSLYMNRIVPLFPQNASRLIKWYQEGCNAGITNHYSTNGVFLAIATMIGASGLAVYWETSKKWKFLVYTFLCAGALLLTGKRGPLLFAGAALYVMFYFFLANKSRNRFVNMLGIAICCFLLLFISVNIFDELKVGILRLFDESESSDITSGRLAFWVVAFNQFQKNPILGIGWTNFRNIMQQFTDYNRAVHAHNIYIQLLCETGVVGFVCFVTFFALSLKQTIGNFITIRTKQYLVNNQIQFQFSVAMVLQVYFLLYGVTGNPLYDAMVFVPYFAATTFSGNNQYEV